MSNLNINLLNVLVDYQNESDSVLIKQIEAEIAKSKPYDHTDKGMMEACGVPDVEFDELLSILNSSKYHSEIVEVLEKQFSKRELAFFTEKIYSATIKTIRQSQ